MLLDSRKKFARKSYARGTDKKFKIEFHFRAAVEEEEWLFSTSSTVANDLFVL